MSIICNIEVENGKIIDSTKLNTLTFPNMPIPTIGVGQGRFGEDCLDKQSGGFINVKLGRKIKSITISYWIYIRELKVDWFEPININAIDNFIYIHRDTSWRIYFGGSGGTGSLPNVTINRWIHVYINVNQRTVNYYVDGNKYTNTVSPIGEINSVQIFGSHAGNYDICDCKMSNIVVWNRWRDFTGVPQQPFIIPKSLYVSNDKKVFKVGD